MADSRARLIDVSHHQRSEAMRWPAWRTLGIVGAIIRAGHGNFIDQQHMPHRTGARAAGLLSGAYWYLEPWTNPETQAQMLSEALMPDDELGAWLDVEQNGLAESHVRLFIAEWARLTARPLGIYTSAGSWHDIVGNGPRTWANGMPLWVAGYPFDGPSDKPQLMDPQSVALRSTPPLTRKPDVPDPWRQAGWLYWQHTGHGRLPSYNADLDLNVCALTEAELRVRLNAPIVLLPDTLPAQVLTLARVARERAQTIERLVKGD